MRPTWPSSVTNRCPVIQAIPITAQTRALASGYSVDVYTRGFRPLRNTLSGRAERSLFKLVVDAKTDRLLGCHLFSPEAAEIIQVVAVAMKMGATKAQFDATVALHPSLAEELVTMHAKSYSRAPE